MSSLRNGNPMNRNDSTACADCGTAPRLRGWSRCARCLCDLRDGLHRRRDADTCAAAPITTTAASAVAPYDVFCCGPLEITDLRRLGHCPHLAAA